MSVAADHLAAAQSALERAYVELSVAADVLGDLELHAVLEIRKDVRYTIKRVGNVQKFIGTSTR